jgi:hypothetical protein
MRKVMLFVIGLLICAAVYAEEWMEMPNQAGGKILLLNNKCKSGSEGRMVIATTPAGTNINGCWYFFAEMVHIVWEGGSTSSFPLNDFSYRKSR